MPTILEESPFPLTHLGKWAIEVIEGFSDFILGSQFKVPNKFQETQIC